jgi:hypothetical protein
MPVVFRFTDVPVQDCWETWQEHDYTLGFQLTTADDCEAGHCEFSQEEQGVYFSGARLEMVYHGGCGLTAIAAVEVIFDEECGVGCTQVFLYCDNELVASSASAAMGPWQVLEIPCCWYWGSRVFISSCGALIREVTVWEVGDPVEEGSWSVIKALY